MKFLLTNDDGIHAPGLAALERAVSAFGEVITVAPTECHSGCGHQTTTTRPLRVAACGANRYAVDGTPADCVRVGLLQLANDVDWVLAGINSGGNLGVDLFMSGTVAAVREAMLLGKRGIAFSQYRKHGEFNAWEKATHMTTATLHELLIHKQEPASFWNVNFPDEAGETIPARVHCPVDPQHLSFSYELIEGAYYFRSNYHRRPRHAAHDVDICFSGQIAISLVRHTMTP